MKLVKYLAQCEVAARRKCAQFIKDGLVTINGVVIKNPMAEIMPNEDIIKFDGKTLKMPIENKKLYILFYKPDGCITSLIDERNRPTVMNYLQKIRGWKTLYPIGRLDYDTEGLLVLTNDGEYAQKIQHPSNKIIKTYMAKVKGVPNAEALEKLTKNIRVDGASVRCVSARFIKKLKANSWIEIKIISGQNRVIRKLCDIINHSVIKLVRTEIGGFKLSDVPLTKGQYIILNNIQKDFIFK